MPLASLALFTLVLSGSWRTRRSGSWCWAAVRLPLLAAGPGSTRTALAPAALGQAGLGQAGLGQAT